MTKTQFRKKVKSMKPDLMKMIDNRIEKIIDSGAINFDNYENDYKLPKIFMSALGEEIKFQYKPLDEEGAKERDYLRNFL